MDLRDWLLLAGELLSAPAGAGVLVVVERRRARRRALERAAQRADAWARWRDAIVARYR